MIDDNKEDGSGFSISTIEEATKFDSLLDSAVKRKVSGPYVKELIPLDIAFKFSNADRRLFSILFDIKLSFASLALDYSYAMAIYNDGLKLKETSVLDSENIFYNRFEIHRYISSFIFKYRALWDKILGFTVYYYHPEEYEKFCSAKSRKRNADKIFKINENFSDEWNVLKTIKWFDDKYRTPEAHLSGRLYKTSFQVNGGLTDPVLDLTKFWNNLLPMLEKITMILKKLDITPPSP